MITTQQNLQNHLNDGSITQEKYNQYYPYDGMEGSYYSVFVEQTSTKQVQLMDSGYHLRMQSTNILQVCYFWKQIRYSTSVMMEFTRQAAQTITSFDVTDK